jgi:hypothetical protein
MRDDLLEAQASIDWAVAKLPFLKKRLERWLNNNVELSIQHLPDPSAYNLLVARFKQALPLSFNVEVGAYVNVIRSSLDILVCAIGKRERLLNPDGHYFPVANSAADFAAGNYKGSEFVRQLSKDHRSILESYQPYYGGNLNVWACHHLDIVRKHRKLLATRIMPYRMTIADFGLGENFAFDTNVMVGRDNETTFGKIRKGAPAPHIQYTAKVTLTEPHEMEGREVIGAIKGFAAVATNIIEAFANAP